MSKEILSKLQAAKPDEIWLDRKSAFKLAAAITWEAIRWPYIRVGKDKDNLVSSLGVVK